MKNTKVIALRIMGFGMLLLGALSLAMGNNETFLGQFAGKSAPVEGIDAVTGATTSSNGIVAAVNEALAPAQ